MMDHYFGLALGVAYFFVLSGVVIFLAHRGDIGKPSAVPLYLFKRARRIYPMYWIALILLLAATPWLRPSLHTLVDAILLVRTPGDHQLVLGVSWTLFHEILFYGLFATLILNRWLGCGVLAAWWLYSAYVYTPAGPTYVEVWTPLHLLFGLGILTAWVLTRVRLRAPLAIFVLGLVIFVGAVIYCGHLKFVPMIGFVYSGLGSVLIILGAGELERSGRMRIPAFLRFLGAASYSIYLFHPVVLSLLGPWLFRGERLWRLNLPATVSGMFLWTIAVTAGCVAHIVLEAPILRWMGKSVRNEHATALSAAA